MQRQHGDNHCPEQQRKEIRIDGADAGRHCGEHIGMRREQHRRRPPLAQPPGDQRRGLEGQAPDRLLADLDPPLGQQLPDVATLWLKRKYSHTARGMTFAGSRWPSNEIGFIPANGSCRCCRRPFGICLTAPVGLEAPSPTASMCLPSWARHIVKVDNIHATNLEPIKSICVPEFKYRHEQIIHILLIREKANVVIVDILRPSRNCEGICLESASPKRSSSLPTCALPAA